ncbi:hypothetical protein TcWFU_003727 [Taenia crassiceps]|uniref:Fibronectin type-III domain-containing protein n=1 Tax=Taenia crassiceps TaxID=6207 RepID=A0ABR4PZI5_9CEST
MPIHLATHGNTIEQIDGRVPRNVQIRAINSSSVELRWDPPSEPDGDVTGYLVRWFLNNTVQDEIEVSPKNTSYIIAGLEPGQTVSAHVKTVSRKKDSEVLDYVSGPSEEVSLITTVLEGGFINPRDDQARWTTYFLSHIAFHLRHRNQKEKTGPLTINVASLTSTV